VSGSSFQQSQSRVRRLRSDRGWSQQQLAVQAGLSRPEVSAIETGRVVPSVKAALALGSALGTSVEALFGSVSGKRGWAWQPRCLPCRVWLADVGSRRLAFPCESGFGGLAAHDMVVKSEPLPEQTTAAPPTLVIAGCDPAVGLLVDALRARGLRVLVLVRSSSKALELLHAGLVHVAGIHLAGLRSAGNAPAVLKHLGKGYRLWRWAVWETGVAVAPQRAPLSLDTRQLARLRWVGRDAGSGARRSLDRLFAGAPPRFELVASDHREVAQTIRLGAADAGMCIRVAADEAGLDFLRVRCEPYDLCFSQTLATDPAISALGAALSDPQLKRLLGEVPGYESKSCGLQADVV
jgi:molybdate-binding protein/DNA-binding XRE family transcriptional regulator